MRVWLLSTLVKTHLGKDTSLSTFSLNNLYRHLLFFLGKMGGGESGAPPFDLLDLVVAALQWSVTIIKSHFRTHHAFF